MQISDKRIHEIADDPGAPVSIKNEVLDWLMEFSDEARPKMINELLTNGCASGLVGRMTAPEDTVAFYQRNKEAIFKLACNQAAYLGYKNVFAFLANLSSAGDVRSAEEMENLLAWFGFEETARQIALELDLDIDALK